MTKMELILRPEQWPKASSEAIFQSAKRVHHLDSALTSEVWEAAIFHWIDHGTFEDARRWMREFSMAGAGDIEVIRSALIAKVLRSHDMSKVDQWMQHMPGFEHHKDWLKLWCEPHWSTTHEAGHRSKVWNDAFGEALMRYCDRIKPVDRAELWRWAFPYHDLQCARTFKKMGWMPSSKEQQEMLESLFDKSSRSSFFEGVIVGLWKEKLFERSMTSSSLASEFAQCCIHGCWAALNTLIDLEEKPFEPHLTLIFKSIMSEWADRASTSLVIKQSVDDFNVIKNMASKTHDKEGFWALFDQTLPQGLAKTMSLTSEWNDLMAFKKASEEKIKIKSAIDSSRSSKKAPALKL